MKILKRQSLAHLLLAGAIWSCTAARAEDPIPYVSAENIRITLELQAKVFSRLLVDEMARHNWHTVSQELWMVSFYRPVTADLAKRYEVPAATDPENPEYLQVVTGFFYAERGFGAHVIFSSYIERGGKTVEHLKDVLVPDEVKALTRKARDSMADKTHLTIAFQEWR